MKTALTIAGFDPSSGAGVTADLMVFAAHGLFGTSCITALTVQSTLGVKSTHPVESGIVRETLQWLDNDLRPDGVKIGMVSEELNCLEIVRYIELLNASNSDNYGSVIPVVLDPVMRSSSGRDLLNRAAFAALQEGLLPQINWITPNIEELAALTGKVVCEQENLPGACLSLQKSTENKGRNGKLGILAKGGHLGKPDDYLLTPDGVGHWLPGERVETQATHGTGCALSSAFLSRLIQGHQPVEAARLAKVYVAGALRTAHNIGNGCGPINHLWDLHKVIVESCASDND